MRHAKRGAKTRFTLRVATKTVPIEIPLGIRLEMLDVLN
jgi:hypothetical protein